MNVPKNGMGIGKALINNGRLYYNGTVPDECHQNEQLICIKKIDLELLLNEAQYQQTLTKLEMHKQFFEQKDGGSIFPDEVHWTTGKNGEVTKLYLDRHWYTYDPIKYVWLRYESVDEAEVEGEI